MSLPPFPAEIWRAILRYSVEIPRSLDTKWDYSPDALLWHEWEPSYYYAQKLNYQQEYSEALKTKLSIVQVSKTWRQIGVELLYEHLSFFDDEEAKVGDVFQQMEMVATILEQYANESGYGRATKRVDVPNSALNRPTLPTLMRLLTSCRNLRILIVYEMVLYQDKDCDAQGLSSLASLLQSRFSHSLRRLSFNMEQADMAQDSRPLEYHIHLPNLPLDSLELGADSLSPSEPPTAITTVSALTIKTSYLSLKNMASWQCPALRHLTLIHLGDESILSFLISHGPQLFSLALFSIASLENTQHISRLVAPATNLRCLVFEYLNAYGLSEKDIFPSITHIGILSEPQPIYSYSNPDRFFATSIFPNLRCLRFLGISDERPRWLLDIARAFNHVRVENKDCQSIL